jgi:hypothetical protein
MRYREIQSGVVLDRGSRRGVTRNLRGRVILGSDVLPERGLFDAGGGSPRGWPP